MAAYFNLHNNEISKKLSINKCNTILDNHGGLVLNDQSITLPHNEPQRSPGFILLQNTIGNNSGEFGLDETLTECKVSIFLNVTTLFDQIQPYHFYIS